MYIELLMLLGASGALGAGLRRPRQQEGGTSGGSPFQPTQLVQQFQTNPQEIFPNTQGPFPQQPPIPQGFGPQGLPQGFPQGLPVGQQQLQQQQQGAGSAFFTNRNPPQQAFFVNRNPPVQQEPIPIISYENVQPGDGTYRFSYETGNGIKHEESGEQRSVGEPPEAGTVSRGSYSYTDLDGNQVAVTYTADENGFQPSGTHIPTPPPIPREIMAALERSAQVEAAQNNGVISPSYHYFFRNYRRV